MMLDVPHCLQHQLAHGDEAGFAVNGGALPHFSWLHSQDSNDVPTQGGEEIELFAEIERLIV
jgi:hypothetical protein